MIANLPPLHETKPHCTHPLSPTGRHRDDIGDATGTRAAGTSAPTTHRAMSAHARHVRTRTPCAHLVRHAVPGAPLPTGRHRGRPRVRGPPGTSAPTTHRAMSVNARYARTRTPCAHLVGRDVLGAPRPRDDIGDAHGHAGRRGRRPLPRTAPRPHTHTARRTRTPRPHTHAMRVPGRARRPRRAAPTERPRDDIGNAHGDSGRRGRRPLPRTAPCPHTHIARRTRTPCPHTHAMRAPGPARRPRRAVAHGTSTGRHRGRPRARGPPGTSAPTTFHTTPPW